MYAHACVHTGTAQGEASFVDWDQKRKDYVASKSGNRRPKNQAKPEIVEWGDNDKDCGGMVAWTKDHNQNEFSLSYTETKQYVCKSNNLLITADPGAKYSELKGWDPTGKKRFFTSDGLEACKKLCDDNDECSSIDVDEMTLAPLNTKGAMCYFGTSDCVTVDPATGTATVVTSQLKKDIIYSLHIKQKTSSNLYTEIADDIKFRKCTTDRDKDQEDLRSTCPSDYNGNNDPKFVKYDLTWPAANVYRRICQLNDGAHPKQAAVRNRPVSELIMWAKNMVYTNKGSNKDGMPISIPAGYTREEWSVCPCVYCCKSCNAWS